MVDDVASLKAWETTRARAEFAISAPHHTSRWGAGGGGRGGEGLSRGGEGGGGDTHRALNSPRQQRSRLSPQLFAYIFACESSPLPALRIAVARLEEKWKVRPYLD